MVLNLDTASLNQSLVLNLVDEDTAIVGDEAFMNPVDSSETSFGYYMSKDFDAFNDLEPESTAWNGTGRLPCTMKTGRR